MLASNLIVVINRRAVVERGTHPKPLARGGLFARLHRERFAADPLPDHPPAEAREGVPTTV